MCRKSAGGDRAVNVEQAPPPPPPVSDGPRSTDDIGSVAFRGPGADLCGTPSVCLRKRPAVVAGGDDDDDDGVDMVFSSYCTVDFNFNFVRFTFLFLCAVAVHFFLLKPRRPT